ncbi:MAG: helix-turn-helix transcriptional regulator [Clostridia bacterium]|nr:helix-turn-helix transcriptional regulator [Clostridia bacterium]
MSIGQRISELRRRASLSQEYVAEKIGVSRQAVSKWETDASAPDTYNLIALAELFGVSVEYLATGKTPIPEPTQHGSVNGSSSTQRILGFILLGAGLLSLILGILLTEILVLLSFYMILGSVICLALRKNIWFISMWAFIILTFLCFRSGIFSIFHPSFYQGGMVSIWLYVSFVFWISLVASVIVTVIRAVKEKKKNKK